MVQTELDVLRDISDRLTSGGIAFMLTGSMAMNYYAQPRMTRAIDLVVKLVSAQIDILMSTFEQDYYVERRAVARAIADGRCSILFTTRRSSSSTASFLKAISIVRRVVIEYSRVMDHSNWHEEIHCEKSRIVGKAKGRLPAKAPSLVKRKQIVLPKHSTPALTIVHPILLNEIVAG